MIECTVVRIVEIVQVRSNSSFRYRKVGRVGTGGASRDWRGELERSLEPWKQRIDCTGEFSVVQREFSMLLRSASENQKACSCRWVSVFEDLNFVPTRPAIQTRPTLRYENKTGEERNLVIFKDIPMNSHITGELSTRPFHWYDWR